MNQRGQASLVLVGLIALLIGGTLIAGALARAEGGRGDAQQAADLGALAASRGMAKVYTRVYEPSEIGGRPNPGALPRARYLADAADTARRVAGENGFRGATVSFPGAARQLAPTRIAVTVGGQSATAQLDPGVVSDGIGATNQYNGPFAYRQGKPMRPDVALAFDRLAAAAAKDGIALIVVSGWRSNAEQAQLFAAHPDPKWVAPPGQSLHRMGTELDLGPPSAYAWLAANAGRFHFLARYSWEPWHFGYLLNPASTPARSDGHATAALPAFVPAAYVDDILAASQRWSVSAVLLAAQIEQESGFDPNAASGAGAMGISQFEPGTAAAYGLTNPYDPKAAIDAQAHLMRDLLRQFGSVALALAAYNAGPLPVQRCGCVPPIPETEAYVAAILGRMGGAGDPQGLTLRVRLVA